MPILIIGDGDMAWEKFKYAETDTVLPAKILVVDELAEFLTNVDRKDMRLADKLQDNFASIAQLGRAAHIHLVLATQSATGNLFPSSLKNNISTRFICGRVESNISRMAIDSEEGESIPLTKGSYLAYSNGETQSLQGYYTSTKAVLSMGTVKDGYDKNTGLPLEEGFDMSPVEDFSEEEIEEEEQENENNEDDVLDDIELDDKETEIDDKEFDVELGTDLEDKLPDEPIEEVSEENISEPEPPKAIKFKISSTPKEKQPIKFKMSTNKSGSNRNIIT